MQRQGIPETLGLKHFVYISADGETIIASTDRQVLREFANADGNDSGIVASIEECDCDAATVHDCMTVRVREQGLTECDVCATWAETTWAVEVCDDGDVENGPRTPEFTTYHVCSTDCDITVQLSNELHAYAEHAQRQQYAVAVIDEHGRVKAIFVHESEQLARRRLDKCVGEFKRRGMRAFSTPRHSTRVFVRMLRFSADDLSDRTVVTQALASR